MYLVTKYHDVKKVEITDCRLLEPEGFPSVCSAKMIITLKDCYEEIVLFSTTTEPLPQFVLFDDEKAKKYLPLASDSGIHCIKSITATNVEYHGSKWMELVFQLEDGSCKLCFFAEEGEGKLKTVGEIYNVDKEKAA